MVAGAVLMSLVPIAFFAFLDSLPLEFMIMEEVINLFGGLGVYFIGVYGRC